jgi:hypothetical protein
MHVFHIRGISGILVLLLAIVAALILLLLLPATFMMVLWNALVYESFKGIQIGLYEGFLLWGMVAVLIKLIFKPQIQLQFQSAKTASRPGSKDAKPDAITMDAENAQNSQDASTEESAAAAPVLDNQQNEG